MDGMGPSDLQDLDPTGRLSLNLLDQGFQPFLVRNVPSDGNDHPSLSLASRTRVTFDGLVQVFPVTGDGEHFGTVLYEG